MQDCVGSDLKRGSARKIAATSWKTRGGPKKGMKALLRQMEEAVPRYVGLDCWIMNPFLQCARLKEEKWPKVGNGLAEEQTHSHSDAIEKLTGQVKLRR
jgi:hypothetical protein